MSKFSTPDIIDLLPRLQRYARALTRDESSAEDLVHDALVRAYEKRQSFRPGGDLRTWLMAVLRNVFIDDHRRGKAEAERDRAAAEIADQTSLPEQEGRVRLNQVNRAFMALPEEQRAALFLVSIEGLTYQDAADALKIPVGTLMSRLGRARSALRSFDDEGAVLKLAAPARTRLRIVGGNDD